jgi:ParB-like chromosome segregation protein Spo0J
LLKIRIIKIDEIYIPAARRSELDPQKIEQVAETIMEEAEQRPIQVRLGKGRYVLVKGVNRLEAHKALGNETIGAYIVSAQQH